MLKLDLLEIVKNVIKYLSKNKHANYLLTRLVVKLFIPHANRATHNYFVLFLSKISAAEIV